MDYRILVFWDGGDILSGKWFLMFWKNTVLLFTSVKGSDWNAVLHELLNTWTHKALSCHKMSETTHPMMQHHVLENCNTKPHNMHKCIIIFHTVSTSNKYTYFMPTVTNSWELLCSK